MKIDDLRVLMGTVLLKLPHGCIFINRKSSLNKVRRKTLQSKIDCHLMKKECRQCTHKLLLRLHKTTNMSLVDRNLRPLLRGNKIVGYAKRKAVNKALKKPQQQRPSSFMLKILCIQLMEEYRL